MDYEKIMQRYTDAVNGLFNQMEKSIENLDPENPNDGEKFYQARRSAKERNHLIALEVLNEILTPELKVFIRNLCNNTLDYPDEPIFYKMFGNNPKECDKVLIDDLIEQGVDIEKIEFLRGFVWGIFGADITTQKIDDKEYYVIDSIHSHEDNLIEKFDASNISLEIKSILNEKGLLDETDLKRLKRLLRNVED